MTMHAKVSGSWRTITPYVKVSGTWRTVQSGYVKVSGTWREFFTNVLVYTPAISVSNYTKSGVGGTSTVSFSLNNTGGGSTTGATQSSPGSFTWILAGSASEYEVYVTGSASNGGAFTGTLNSWLSLGTSRTWSFATTNNDSDWTGTYQIRRISDGAGGSTGSIQMSVATAP
jgi:hypothetical protein